MAPLPITLEDVFTFWRANEAWNPKWQKVALEKGFPSWEVWRKKFLQRLAETTTPEWTLEEITEPLQEVPKWYGGPFSGWIKNVYQGKETMNFSEIIKQPFINGHDYIPGLVEHFPKLTILTVVEDQSGNRIVVEGMHRACALTIMAHQGKKHDGKVFIAQGKLVEGMRLSFDIKP
jgi:hypothetical protein